MLKDVHRLLEISQDLGFKDISKRLQKIARSKNSEGCPLMLPMVGEFSSGKTTLINSLTDSKALETATKPTTATIFEVHFGAEQCRAVIMDELENIQEVTDIASIKNTELEHASVVTVFDTSKKVPQNVVLVDTLGLSSPDPRHRQTLIDFLPEADAVLLVVDINAQLSRSLIDFVTTMSLSNKRLYIVLTKINTKSESEVSNSVEYLVKELHIAKENIVAVSANNDNNKELLDLLQEIQKDKAEILEKVNAERLEVIAKDLAKYVDELLNVPADDDGVETEIANQRLRLNAVKRKISSIITSSEEEIHSIQKTSIRKFEDIVANKLVALVGGSCSNFDSEAVSVVDNTTSIVLEQYKNEVRAALHREASKNLGEDGIDASALANVDVSGMNIQGLSYNLNLNSLGHEYDGYISSGIKMAAAVAIAAPAVAGVAGTAGTAGAASASTASTIAVIDTATDVGSMVMTGKLLSKMQKAKQIAGKVGRAYKDVEGNISSFEETTQTKGLFTSIVGSITDKAMGKPQRRRAVNNYLEETLLPQFKCEMENLTSVVVNSVRQSMEQAAEASLGEIVNALNELQSIKKSKDADYQSRLSILRTYAKELSTLK